MKQHGWMDIYTRFQYFTGILMYKFVHNLLPPSVSSMFTLVRNSHSYPTRSSVTNDIALPLPHSEMYKRMLPFNGPKVWNSVPHEMRNSSSLDQFKKSYKKYLLDLFSSPVVSLCHGLVSVVDRAPCSRWCLCRA